MLTDVTALAQNYNVPLILQSIKMHQHYVFDTIPGLSVPYSQVKRPLKKKKSFYL